MTDVKSTEIESRMNAKEIADYLLNMGAGIYIPRLAQAYLDLLAQNERLSKVVEAAKLYRKAWNQNREELYRRLDLEGHVLAIDPDFRPTVNLGLNEALDTLEREERK